MEEFSPPYEYIDILIGRKDYSELLYFYNTYDEVREYLDREDKLELLSRQFGVKFETFNDFSAYYIAKMIDILPEGEAIEFAVEFWNPVSQWLIIEKLKDTDILLRKFRVATIKENYNSIRKLARILYAKRGNIYLTDLMFVKDLKKVEKVINDELGTQYVFNPQKGYWSEHGDLKRIISLLNSGEYNKYDVGVNLLSIYDYHLGGTEDEFREILSLLELFMYKPGVIANIRKKLSEAIPSPQMREDANKYLAEMPPSQPYATNVSKTNLFDMLLSNEININEIDPNSLPDILSAGDSKARWYIYPDAAVERVIKLILSRVTDIPTIKSPQFRRIINEIVN